MRINGVSLYQQNGSTNKTQKAPAFGAELQLPEILIKLAARRFRQSNNTTRQVAMKYALQNYNKCRDIFSKITSEIEGTLENFEIKGGNLNLMHHSKGKYTVPISNPVTLNLKSLIQKLANENELENLARTLALKLDDLIKGESRNSKPKLPGLPESWVVWNAENPGLVKKYESFDFPYTIDVA